jgi:hypothetical protein
MCGGGGSKAAPKQATPQYSYFPESARSPQQQAAGVVASGAQSQAGFGSELSAGATPSASPAKTTTGM